MVGIIILNYVNWNETIKCIESIKQNENKCNYHIYVVDNASPIPTPEEIKQYYNEPKITFIQKKENDGYSAGNNVGIKQAILDGCKEILIANSDIIFNKDSIYNMKKFLNENREVGIVGPKVFTPEGHLQKITFAVKTDLKGKYKYLLRKTIFSPMVKSYVDKFSARDKDLTKPFEVHSVHGCCFMMSANCVKDITPLDENTFLYQEELIIGITMEEKGYKTVYLPDSEVVHAHGQSTKHIKAFSYICLVESEFYYFKKYLKTSFIALFPLYLIRTLKYLVMSFKSKDFRENFIRYFKRTFKTILQT